MKTLIDKRTDESKYIWPDDAAITILDNMTTTPDFFIADMTTENAVLVQNVVPPSDWVGCKYLFKNGEWSVNSKWVDPNSVPPIQDVQ